MTDRFDASTEVSGGLRKILNAHGYGFQYAVQNEAKRLFEKGASRWRFEAAEVPVVAGSTTVHIDFLLRSVGPTAEIYLIAECKRAEPARARWCFARAPYTWRNAIADEVIFEQVSWEPPNNQILGQNPFIYRTDQGPYHHGFELKTKTPGEGQGQATGAINAAVAQVLRGTSGFINHLYSYRSFTRRTSLRFIPVIFTTAELWVTDTDLSQAELTTGILAPEAVTAHRIDCLWFTHNRSPDLRHGLTWGRTNDDLSMEMRREFARSMAIVSPSGIERFLTMEGERLILY